jgi:hypothetical protein
VNLDKQEVKLYGRARNKVREPDLRVCALRLLKKTKIIAA